MTLDERATSVVYIPYGDFTRPETLEERGLRHFIPMYLSSFRTWSDNITRGDGPDRSGTEFKAFDDYLRRAFARVDELRLVSDRDFLGWNLEYIAERIILRNTLALEDIAA